MPPPSANYGRPSLKKRYARALKLTVLITFNNIPFHISINAETKMFYYLITNVKLHGNHASITQSSYLAEFQIL